MRARADPPKPTHKLRRQRQFAGGTAIRSGLARAGAPQTRRFVGAGGEAADAPFLVAPPAGLTLDAAVDRIVCGDAAAVLRQLPPEWCAAAITSPPYWHTVDYGVPGQIGPGSYAQYLEALDAVWAEVARVLLPNGKLCLNVPILPLPKAVSGPAFGPSHTRLLLDLYSDMKQRIERQTPLKLFSLYVWEKQTTEKMFGSYPHPPNLYERNYIELIAVFVKPGRPRILPRGVKQASRLSQAEWMDLTQQIWWIYPENVPRLAGHPAPFPEALPNRLIAMYTFRAVPEQGFAGDIVLDPLAGSGTTCVAARRLARRYLGIDLHPDFCGLAAQRVASTACDPRVLPARRPGGGSS